MLAHNKSTACFSFVGVADESKCSLIFKFRALASSK